ncbi:hypothetical protein B5X24_HaOG210926 [Helicoverpa armigera]|uniref:long-chain-fatty-acid--CoA ligase n=1 Tax=Helicoverpa armigera TaxID=29058 RepID=A0A2W1BC62_HELAM|nr:hypothetical protein B5X24_HaOG210926 [Helicoverpa armigera]
MESSIKIWKDFVKRFNIKAVTEFYGATEGNANIANVDGTPGAIGFVSRIFPKVYPIAIIKVNQETGEPIRDSRGLCQLAQPNEPGVFIGKIQAHNPARQYLGYVDKAASEKKVVKDVFQFGDAAFISGDILTADEFGYLFFRDRTGDTFRWRGENVSTTEVEAAISRVAEHRDAVVYGVLVPNTEGRAGMCGIVDVDGTLDLEILARNLARDLPVYARPVFIRVMDSLDMTGTFKMKKTDLQKDSFDPKLAKKDKLYYLDLAAVCPTGLIASMDAILAALVALMALAAAMAAVLSTLSKAAIFVILAVAPCVYRYRRHIYVFIKTLPRDSKFLWRYANGMIRSKRWGRQDATVAQLFTQRALKNPDAPCFYVVGDRDWTFGEMAANSNKVARVMQEHLGLKRGDVVCVFMPNCGEYVWTWLGMAKLGAVSALINSNLRHKPLLHCIQVAKAKAVVFSDQLADAISEIREQLPSDLKLFQLYGECSPGVLDLAAEMEKHPPDYPEVTDKPRYKDTLLYIYTSGTTGMPKAAVLPNSKYLLVVVATVHMLGLKKSDRMYNPLPLYHTAGGLVGTGAALVDGIPSVLRAKFSASNYWADCIKYDCTVAQYIGEMCRYLLAQPARDTDTQHRVRIMVGNGMRSAIWQQIVDRFKVPQINEIYGATEGNANIINVDNTVGAVGFLPKLVPTCLHPIALVRADEQGGLVRGADGYCIRCKPIVLLTIVERDNIPQTEGRAGMACVADPSRALCLRRVAAELDDALPSYARPLFIRLINDIEITGTFKLKKLQYQKEGFDPEVIKDPLYFRSGPDFVPVTPQLYTDICTGKIKL